MPAPSKSWVVIADSSVDADSPLDTTLITALRDDLVHLEEWLGDGYTAAKDHNHDGINSKSATVANGAITQNKLGYTAGDTLIIAADTAYTGVSTATTWILKKEIKISRAGTLRIKFDMERDSGTNAVHGRIYRNGVAVGTEQIKGTGGGYTTYSEDIAGWTPGDLCQFYLFTESGALANYRNFRLYDAYHINAEAVILN